MKPSPLETEILRIVYGLTVEGRPSVTHGPAAQAEPAIVRFKAVPQEVVFAELWTPDRKWDDKEFSAAIQRLLARGLLKFHPLNSLKETAYLSTSGRAILICFTKDESGTFAAVIAPDGNTSGPAKALIVKLYDVSGVPEHREIRLQGNNFSCSFHGAALIEGAPEPGGAAASAGGEAGEPPMLSKNAQAVREILLGLQPCQGMTGPDILKALGAKGIFIDQSTLTSRTIPELKPYGIENKRRVGYRIAPKRRLPT